MGSLSLTITGGQVATEGLRVSQTTGLTRWGGRGKGEGGGFAAGWRASKSGIEGESGLRRSPVVKVMEAPNIV